MKKVKDEDLKKTTTKNQNFSGNEIELEKAISGEESYNDEFGESDAEDNDSGKIIHIAFLIIVIGLILAAIIMIVRWNKGKDLIIDEAERENTFNMESMDYYSRFDPSENEGYVDDGQLNIVIMGDDALASCTDETSIPALIEKASGGNVITLALEGQTFSNISSKYSLDDTEDAFNLLLTLVQLSGGETGDCSLMEAGIELMDGDTEIYQNYMERCSEVNLSQTDILIIMGGQNDYLLGRPCYVEPGTDGNNDLNNMSVTLSKAMLVIRERFPNLQIIVASPSMMKTLDKDGNLVGADKVNNGNGTYGNYISGIAGMCQMNCITFVDNYILPEFNPDNYEDCLEPNGLYPNEKGRKMIADHIVENFYFNRQKMN